MIANAMKTFLAVVLLGLFVSACEEQGPAEQAGEAIDNTVDQAGEALEDAGDAAEEATSN